MASDRSRKGGGNEVSLATPYQVTYSYGNRDAGIVRGDGADWFGPLNPMNPTAPAEVAGRRFDFPSGYNLVQTPRAYEAVGFYQLRQLADSYDLLRLVIETRKDQISRLKWNVTPRDWKKKRDDDTRQRCLEVEKFFIRPDRKHFWDEWLRMVLEDLLVLDAPTLYRRRTLEGKLYALDIMDGSTIKLVIDDWGRTPTEPDVPAYQQVLKGLPAVDYTYDELLYKPRNRRSHKIYGYSPVEQIIMTVNIALRRQIFQLNYFTEGNIPEALIGVPETWGPDQIRQFQDWFDGVLQGNLAERRRARFVPAAIGKTYIETKGTELFGKAEEWLARVTCFAFSIPAQPFVAMMNRNTAETAAEEAAMEGLAPLQNWIKGLVDTVILDDFGYDDLEFRWQEDEEIDPTKKQIVLSGYTGDGLMSLNEGRIRMGLDPDPDPMFDKLLMRTSMGYIDIAAGPIPTTAQTAAGEGQPKPDDLAGSDPVLPAGEDVQAQALNGAQVAALQALLVSASTGEIPVDSLEPTILAAFPLLTPEQVAQIVAPIKNRPVQPPKEESTIEAVAGSDGPVKAVAEDEQELKEEVREEGVPYVDPERKEVKDQTSSLSDTLASVFASQADRVVELFSQVVPDLTATKADAPDWVEEFLVALEADLRIVIDNLEPPLTEVFGDSGRKAVAQIGPDDEAQLVRQVNAAAVKWSSTRVADLVSGIDETTKQLIRTTITEGLGSGKSAEEIAESLRQSYAFSAERAELIAETETARANSYGALEGYKKAQEAGLQVKKSWLRLEDACPVCQENEEAGEIEVDEAFPSGDLAPPAHPHCRCVIVPKVVGDGE